MTKRYLLSQPLLLLGLLGALGLTSPLAHSEIYRWVDAQGKVHFSDKRAAQKDAALMGKPAHQVTDDGYTFTLLPQADAMLSNSMDQPQGQSRVLSSGYWQSQARKFETKSLLQFEISPLLTELNSNKTKRLASATIELYANTEDNYYGQGATNKESPGHSTLRGDNAFYLKPVHNNWVEADVTWDSFYNSKQPTPAAIRQLPAISASGSDGVPDKNYVIDATELVAGLILAQQREVTLEMSPQRQSQMAQVTFCSRETTPELAPKLIVKLR